MRKFIYLLFLICVSCTNPIGDEDPLDTSSEAPPEAFDFLTVQRIDQQLLVSWTNAKGAKSYELHYGTTAATYTSMKVVSKSPAVVTGLTPGTTYYFRVKAINELGTVDSTSEKSYPFMGAPGAFNQLTATPIGTQVALSWEASAEAASYAVTYGTTPGSFPTAAGSTTSTSTLISGLSSNVTYYFQVTASNAAGTRTSTNSLSAILAPPDAFTLTTAVPSSTQVVLNWNASGRALNYTVRYGTAEGAYTTTAGTTASTNYTITGLTNSVPYYFQVSANNAAGSTASTNFLTATPNARPTVPLSPTVVVDTGKCTINWLPPASGAPPITYTVRRIVNPSVSVPVCSDIAVRTCSEESLSSGTHVYRVEAINAAGAGPQTADISCNLSPPGAVTLNPAGTVAGNQQVTLTWTGGAQATSFTVKYGTLSPPTTVASTSATSPYVVSGLTNGTLYYFQVEATNAYGTVSSLIRSATPVSNPPNVTFLDQALTVNTGIPQIVTLGDTYSRRFSVADPDPSDTVDCGTATMTSSNPGVIPNSNLSVSGSGGTCTFSVVPQGGVYGQAGITLSITDGQNPRNVTINAYALPIPQRIYSWRKHRGYTGPALTVRNPSSGVETDIYFDATTGLVDAYLTTFSGTTGRLVRWYDQSGNGKHAYQLVEASQPIVQLAGDGSVRITADGVDDYMILPDFPTAPILTTFTHFVLTAQAVEASLLSFGNDTVGALEGFEIGRTAGGVWNIRSAADANTFETTTGPTMTTGLLGQAMVLNTSGSLKRNFITANATAGAAASTAPGTLSSYVAPSVSDAYLFSGGPTGNSRFIRGWIRELLIFNRELTAVEMKALATQN